MSNAVHRVANNGASGQADPTERGFFSPGPFANDLGQALPLTAAALAAAGPQISNDWWAMGKQQEMLTAALGTERLLVPAPIEQTPGRDGKPCESGSLLTANSPLGPAVVAFSCLAQMQAWNPSARPVPMDSARVALVALASSGGRLLVDPAGAAVLLGRPALAALASGDKWLPAWRDTELIAQLRTLVAEVQMPGVDWDGEQLFGEALPGGALRGSVSKLRGSTLELRGAAPQPAGGVQLVVALQTVEPIVRAEAGSSLESQSSTQKQQLAAALGQLRQLQTALQACERLNATATYTVLTPVPNS